MFNAMDPGFNPKLVPSSAIEFALSERDGDWFIDKEVSILGASPVEERAGFLLRHFGTDEELLSLGVDRDPPGPVNPYEVMRDERERKAREKKDAWDRWRKECKEAHDEIDALLPQFMALNPDLSRSRAMQCIAVSSDPRKQLQELREILEERQAA